MTMQTGAIATAVDAAHIIDDLTKLKDAALRELAPATDLLANAQHAASYGRAVVADEFIDRAMRHIDKALAALRTRV